MNIYINLQIYSQVLTSKINRLEDGVSDLGRLIDLLKTRWKIRTDFELKKITQTKYMSTKNMAEEITFILNMKQ